MIVVTTIAQSKDDSMASEQKGTRQVQTIARGVEVRQSMQKERQPKQDYTKFKAVTQANYKIARSHVEAEMDTALQDMTSEWAKQRPDGVKHQHRQPPVRKPLGRKVKHRKEKEKREGEEEEESSVLLTRLENMFNIRRKQISNFYIHRSCSPYQYEDISIDMNIFFEYEIQE